MADTEKDAGTKSEDKSKAQTDANQGDKAKDITDSSKKGASDDGADDEEELPKGKTFSQKELDDIIKKRLAEERDRRKREQGEAEAKAKGEFEKLANQYQTQRDAAEEKAVAAEARLAALSEAVDQLVTVRIKALPETIRDLRPDTEDRLSLLNWLSKAEKAASKSRRAQGETGDEGEQKSGKPGNGADPKAAKPGEKQGEKKTAAKSADVSDIEVLRSRGGYGDF